MSGTVPLKLNEPVKITLACESGELDGHNVVFQTQDGRSLVVTRSTAEKIYDLEVKPGESICITKLPDGKGKSIWYDVRLSTSTEKARAAQEAEEARRRVPGYGNALVAPQQGLRRCPQCKNLRPPEAFCLPVTSCPCDACRQETAKTEFDATWQDLKDVCQPPPPPTRKQARQAPPGKVSYREAVPQLLKVVSESLKRENVAWGDGPQQDLVSTLIIAASKAGAIDWDLSNGEVPR